MSCGLLGWSSSSHVACVVPCGHYCAYILLGHWVIWACLPMHMYGWAGSNLLAHACTCMGERAQVIWHVTWHGAITAHVLCWGNCDEWIELDCPCIICVYGWPSSGYMVCAMALLSTIVPCDLSFLTHTCAWVSKLRLYGMGLSMEPSLLTYFVVVLCRVDTSLLGHACVWVRKLKLYGVCCGMATVAPLLYDYILFMLWRLLTITCIPVFLRVTWTCSAMHGMGEQDQVIWHGAITDHIDFWDFVSCGLSLLAHLWQAGSSYMACAVSWLLLLPY